MRLEFNKRKAKFIGSSLQRKTLFLVFAAALVPTAIVAICLYYMIFGMLASQFAIPEAVAYYILPVARRINLIILIALPITLFVIWIMALELSHNIAGPIKRLEKELDEIIAGKEASPIKLREKDELKPLADRINRLLNK